jgi:acyl carrier protein
MRSDPSVVGAAPYAEVVRALVAEVLGVSIDSVRPTSALVRDLGAESIDFLDLVFRIEDVIGRRIPIGRWERFVDVRLPDGDHARTITTEIVREFAELEACG